MGLFIDGKWPFCSGFATGRVAYEQSFQDALPRQPPYDQPEPHLAVFTHELHLKSASAAQTPRGGNLAFGGLALQATGCRRWGIVQFRCKNSKHPRKP